MKNISSLVILLFCFTLATFGQQANNEIAPFKIRLVDGAGFTAKQLVKNKPTILIYFLPDCAKCKAFTAALCQRLNALQSQQIVMVTYEDIKSVIDFDRQFQLSKHKNIKIGSEGYTFIVQKYYGINHFPFVAKYGKNGKLIKILSPDLSPKEKAAQL